MDHFIVEKRRGLRIARNAGPKPPQSQLSVLRTQCPPRTGNGRAYVTVDWADGRQALRDMEAKLAAVSLENDKLRERCALLQDLLDESRIRAARVVETVSGKLAQAAVEL